MIRFEEANTYETTQKKKKNVSHVALIVPRCGAPRTAESKEAPLSSPYPLLHSANPFSVSANALKMGSAPFEEERLLPKRKQKHPLFLKNYGDVRVMRPTLRSAFPPSFSYHAPKSSFISSHRPTSTTFPSSSSSTLVLHFLIFVFRRISSI